ncbi:unnamed protein product, partial [Closterium sp. Yama58-4]
VPYCACPDGYGITATECVAGGASNVSFYSFTVIANRTARDNSSRPITFRPNLNSCTQYPEAVAREGVTVYFVQNTNDAPGCSSWRDYSNDHCGGATDYEYTLATPELFVATYSL